MMKKFWGVIKRSKRWENSFSWWPKQVIIRGRVIFLSQSKIARHNWTNFIFCRS
jgi:hypothetical protein